MLKGTLILGIADFSKKALLALTVLMCARMLPHKVFGDYMFLLSFYQVFSVLGGSGIPNTLLREVSQTKWLDLRPYLVSVIARLVYIFPVGILMYATIKIVRYPINYLPLVGAMVLLMVFRGATENAIAIFQAHDDQMACAQISIVQSTIALIGTLFVCITSQSLAGLIFVLVFAAGGSFLMATSMIWFRKKRLGLTQASGLAFILRTSGWLNGGAFLASAYNRLDVLLLRRMSTAEAVGLYSAPYRLLDLTQIIPSSVMGVLLPKLCRGEADGEDPIDFSVFLRYLLVCAVIVVVVVTIFASFITRVVLGRGYGASIFCLQILVLAVIPMFWNFALNSQLIAVGYDRAIVWAAALALAFNFASNVMLIPRFGFIACAVTTCLTEIVLLGANLFFVLKVRQAGFPDFPIRISFCIASILTFWFLWTLGISRSVSLVLAIVGLCFVPFFRKDFSGRSALGRRVSQYS